MYNNIKSFKEACKHQNVPETLPDFSMYPDKFAKGIIAFTKLIIITAAINDNREPNFNDSSERKYYPWYWIKADDKHSGGFAFFDSCCVYAITYAYLGSRLCFFDEASTKFAINQFEKIYLDFLLIM